MAACIRSRSICYALLRAAKMRGAERVFVHAFLDGRDTLPTSGAGYLEALERAMQEIGVGKLATVSGRYYAMDRDRRWERERLTFDAMVKGTAEGGRAHGCHRAREGELQPGRDRRVRCPVRCGGCGRRTGGAGAR